MKRTEWMYYAESKHTWKNKLYRYNTMGMMLLVGSFIALLGVLVYAAKEWR